MSSLLSTLPLHQPTLPNILLSLLTALTLYLLTLALYRLYLHPLSRFPGPTLAALTYLYEIHHDVFTTPNGQFATHLNTLHARYGPIIRCSPDEIHVQDSAWFDTLIGGPGHVRDKWAKANRANGSPGSLASATGHELHRMRRGALNPFFSKRTVDQLETSIRAKTEKLCAKIAEYAREEKVVELGTAFTALTLDVITEYCYDKCQNCLDEEDFAPRWKALMMQLFESTPVAKHFPIVAQTLASLPRFVVKYLNPGFVPFFEAQDLIQDQARQIWLAEQKNPSKPTSEDERPKTIFHGILNSNLPPQEKSMQRMADEAFVLIVAGGETTARVATVILANLLQNPTLYQRLRKEIANVMSGPELPSTRQLEDIPLMRAVVQEGIRIAAPVTSRPMLIAPNEEMRYKEWVIPRSTPTSMTLQSVLFDPEIFPSPHTFDPERWIRAAEEGKRLDRFLVTFSKGTRMCIGTNVAYAEMYLAVAALVARFDFEFVDFDMKRDLEVTRDTFVGMPSKESRGVRVKVSSVVK
ncbi:hypothetical protein M409DRAFT_25245 [Zasmidium cellare ATCC 36951]|uniref:Cytochrome P450 n=1 Tax=Zasmidium cellare ATCC 36951 TaxID=1080233 RepID=A0A6A6CG25_ZASCE|nr:uncharacterized protein M409DRAFT_25245 [Zasmidium cellare ATCC 36951]KAF2164366.1 hypothetical protein M409DRAFT_25245 [Zasmidium cellare ATCC 36951]